MTVATGKTSLQLINSFWISTGENMSELRLLIKNWLPVHLDPCLPVSARIFLIFPIPLSSWNVKNNNYPEFFNVWYPEGAFVEQDNGNYHA
jgi:hypothetical protein